MSVISSVNLSVILSVYVVNQVPYGGCGQLEFQKRFGPLHINFMGTERSFREHILSKKQRKSSKG